MSDDDLKEDTRDLTFKAADRILVEDGDIATVRDVLAAIKQGSATTIASALKEWKHALGERLRAAETIPGLPPDLARAIVDAWHLEVENQATRAQEAYAQHRRAADQDIEAAKARVDVAVVNHEAAQRRAERLAAEKESWFEQKRILDAALRSAQERAAGAEARIDEYRASMERTIAQADKEVNAVRAQLALTVTRYDDMERRYVKENEHLTKERDQLQKYQNNVLEAYRVKLSEAQDALSQRVGQVIALQATEQKLEQRLAGMQHDINELREVNAEERARAQEWAHQREVMRTTHASERTQWIGQIEKLRADVAQREAQRAALSIENTALKVAAAKAERGGKRD